MRRSRGYGATVVCWSLAMLLFSSIGWVVLVAGQSGPKFVDRLLGEVRLSVMLVDSTSAVDLVDIERVIRTVDGVQSVAHISKAQAVAEFSTIIRHQMVSQISLPASLEVSYTGGSRALDRLKTRLASDRRVGELVYDQGVIMAREELLSTLWLLAKTLGSILLIVVLVLLYFAQKAWAVREDRYVVFKRGFVAAVMGAVVSATLIFGANHLLSIDFAEFSLADDLVWLLISSTVIFAGALGALYGFILSNKKQ